MYRIRFARVVIAEVELSATEYEAAMKEAGDLEFGGELSILDDNGKLSDSVVDIVDYDVIWELVSD